MDEMGLNPHVLLARQLLFSAKNLIKRGELERATKFIDDALDELYKVLEEEAKEIANSY
ncbi:MAG: hypothetical protein J7K15_11760 [Deltaproteobacteria bacterium]|nr:hypothetical protein [Deltaproteobacteria bacterium]